MPLEKLLAACIHLKKKVLSSATKIMRIVMEELIIGTGRNYNSSMFHGVYLKKKKKKKKKKNLINFFFLIWDQRKQIFLNVIFLSGILKLVHSNITSIAIKKSHSLGQV